ncbi:flagellar motor protein MotA [Halorhodospira abdelmalekii]|uniref:MotA/TolQ/ExbB proton channel family protein n=1 Tax=Halorhodospira abdelmalekii TaxID=421629 RepID=UPI0019073B41|nr:MotA/TolQ/ExbB proton channel family protein [Halorhodospira abdelmalekii]MBK1735882.1 flagellar motor protein MotA [Halorhodospira abdelmalekii]
MSSDEASAAPLDVAHSGLLERLSGLFDTGGPVLIVLAVLSVLTVALVLIKLWQFAAARLYDRRTLPLAVAQWRRADYAGAVRTLEASRHLGAEVLAAAMRGRIEHGSGDDPRLREEVTRLATGRLAQLRSYLRGLEAIGMLSPLLGLLGTVLGMIEAFRQLEAAGSQVDPSLLSGGIWEALLTTAAGLALAIPAVAALAWLERVVDAFRLRLEDAVTQVFTTPPPPPQAQQETGTSVGEGGASGSRASAASAATATTAADPVASPAGSSSAASPASSPTSSHAA